VKGKYGKNVKIEELGSDEGLPPGTVDIRKKLGDKWTMWCKYQPIWSIRTYFGEKIALYFAWTGLLITFLWLPTLFGIITFFYGTVLRYE